MVSKFLYLILSLLWINPQNSSSDLWVLDAHQTVFFEKNFFKFLFKNIFSFSDCENFKFPTYLIFLAPSFLTEGRTTIVIAHRLSTILNSNKIFVVDKGKIVGEGRHPELLKDSKIYKNFYEKQIKKK